MPIHSKVKEMHSLLQKAGADVGDLTEFNNWFFAKGDEGYNNRKYVFDTFKQAGADVGDSYEDFAGMLGLQRVQPGQANTSRVDNESFNQTIANARQTIGQTQQTANRIGNRQQRIGLDLPQTDFGRVNLGENRKVTKGQQRFNLGTGQMENTYVTESGNEYETRAGADLEQNAVDDFNRRQANPFGTDMEDAYQEQRSLDARIAELQAKQNAAMRENNGFVYTDKNLFTDEEDEELQNLLAAKRQNDQRIRTFEREKEDYEASGIFDSIGQAGGDFFKGMYDMARDPSVFSFGITDLGDMTQLYKVKRKMDAAKEAGVEPQLTETEQALLQNTMLNNYAQQQYGGNRSDFYGYGQIAMQAIPFVGEFFLTGGFKTLSDIGAKYGAKKAADWALKGWKAAVVKNTGVLAGDLASGWAMANTTGAAKTAADILDRHIGDVYVDKDGQYYFDDGKSLAEAVYEGELVNTFEYYTEKLGDHLNLGEFFVKGAEKYGLKKLSKAVSFLSGSKTLKGLGVHDYPSEVIEEEANLLLNAAFGLDNNFETDPDSKDFQNSIFNRKTQKDIVFGMFFSLGVLNAPRYAKTGYTAAQYKRYQHKVNKADANAASAFGADNWQKIKEQIDGCDNEGMADLVQSLADGGMTSEQKAATGRYAASLATMRGYNSALMAMINGDEEDVAPKAQTSNAVDQSYTEGYDTQEPDLMKRYNDEAQASAADLPKYGKEFAKMVMESESPVETMDYLMLNRDYFTNEQIAAAFDFYQKTSRLNGVMDGALDRIDMQVEQANGEVRANTHQKTGTVITAQVGDRPCYITGGDVVTDEATGMSMVVGTGGAVVVRDAQTGETSVHSPQEINVTSMTNADEMVKYNEQVLRQQLMQQADDDMTFGSPANEVFQLEDTVTLNDGEGNTIEGEIGMMPNSVDGVYVVYTPDGKALQYTADQLNRMVVYHNGQYVSRASEQPQEQQPAAEQQEQVISQEGQVIDEQKQVNSEEEPSAEQQEEEQPVSALSRIPVLQDEKGRPLMNKKGKPQYLWHKASVEDAAAALIETTGGDKLMARDTASDLVKNAQAGLEKIRKQKPKGDDPIEIAESRMEIRRQEQDQQAIIKQWQNVGDTIRKQMEAESAARQAEIEAAKSAEQKAREAEEARQREEKQKDIDKQRIREQIEKDKERRNKEYTPLVKAREEMAGDTDALAILNDIEPRSLEEWVSSLLRPHSMLWQDSSDNEIGLQSELGLKRGDMQRMMSLLGTKESGAKPFGNVVLDIYEALPEGMKNQYTDEDVRNTLLNLFNEGSSSRMMHLTEENRIEEANTIMQENLRREAEAEMEAWAEAYHLTPEERETFEDFMSEDYFRYNMMLNNETEYINQIIADNEQNNRGQAVDLDNTSGTAGRESEGGEEQVQGQGAAETDAADQEQPQPEQGAEADTGEQAVSGDNVPGGTPESGTIAPSEQLKPTDLRDAVRVESPEIGVAEANAKARQAAAKPLSENGAKILMQRMEDAAINDPQISLTPETWANTFGLNNSLETPIGNVKMGDGQYQKFFDKSRSAEFGMAVQTLQDPDVILIEPSQAKEGQVTERPYSYVFVKSFVRDGQKMKYFASVTVQRDNMEVSVSSHIMKPSRVLERLTTLERLYTKETLLPNSSDRHLAEQQDAVPDLLPTQENNVSSVGKVTNNSANLQEKTEKSSKKKKNEPKRLVSDEKMEELRKKLLDKLNNLNAGIDPEMMLLGAMYAVGNIERGVTKFADYAKKMVTDLGDKIRPYLKSFYNAVRDMPEAQEYASQMDDYATVSGFDVYNFDKQQTPDAITKAEQVVTEQRIRNKAKKIQEQPDLFAGDLFGAQTKQESKPKSAPRAKAETQQKKRKPQLSDFDSLQTGKRFVTPDGTIEIARVDYDTLQVWDIDADGNRSNRTRAVDTVDVADGLRSGSITEVQSPTESKSEPRLRPATEADVDSADAKWYHNGKRVYILAITRSGEQVSATQFSKPTVESVMLTNGKSVKLDDLMVEDTSAIGETSTPAQIAAEEAKVDTNPSEAQKEAGNYPKGHIKIDGYDITIENPKGSIRRGTDASGKAWETKMNNTYGYIRGTEAVDGDHIDIFLSDDLTNGNVYVIDQVNPETGEFDESKVMYSFGSEEEAREAYLSNYSKGWKGLGNITEVSREDFKKWIESSHRKTKPFAEYKSVVKSQKKKSDWWNDPNRPQSIDPKDYKTYMTPEAKKYFAQFKGGKTDFTTWAHPNLAYITAAVWDEVEIPYEELKNVPEIVEAEKTIKNAESKGKLVITDEEANNLAQRLIDREQARQERKALVIIGLPAGGKSSVFANPLAKEFGARIIDSDDVKPWLDGFDGGNGAGYVQDASAEVAEKAIDIAVKNGDNIIIPRIGGKSVMDLSAALRLAGYDVQLYFNDVKGVTSIDRAASRFAQTGRYLSLDYLTKKAGVPSENFSKFAEKTLGGYLDERTEKELQNIRGRLQGLLGKLDIEGEGLRLLRSTERGGQGTAEGEIQDSLGSRGLSDEGGGVSGLLNSPLFNYAEWKSNDVPIGEKPKEIWNSESGKPMPGKKEEKNNELHSLQSKQGLSRKPESAGEGAGQASGSADRTGAEPGTESDRTQRTGSGHSIENTLGVPDGGEARDSSEGPAENSTGGITRDASSALPKHNNRRNNVGERGKDYAPLSPKARFNANVEAIKLMRLLNDEGIDAPTKDQMEVLRKYSGWGGMGTFFNDESLAENKQLRDLLSEEEYNDAVMSINSAYYTPAMVIDSLWDIAKAMGFKGGNVLEGSAGIGNIIGQMPKEMSSRSNIEAVEIDSISGNILKLLYPDAKVHIEGFQDVRIPNGTVDLAVTNVPFVTGLHVIDKVDKDLSRKFTNIHDFCIAKNIRKLSEGGIGIFITSAGTMDKSNKLREWITDEGQADVVGAFRLNNTTFGGTNVTSDIVVVRKRTGNQKSPVAIDVAKASPLRVGTWTDKFGNDHQVSMVVNDYFRDHPDMMAGEMAFGYEKGDTFRPGSYGLYPVSGKEQEKMLADFAKSMSNAKETVAPRQQTEQVQNQLTAEKEGRMLVDDKGRLCVSERGVAVPLGINDQKVKGYTKQECFADYQAVQKAVDDALQQQLNDPDDAALKPKLDALNKAYDKFTKRYGTLHKNTSISFLRNDIDFPSFQALENYSETKDMKGKVTVKTAKTPLFSQRVLGFKTEPKPKNVKDALIASIFRSNGIDLGWIAEKLNAAGVKPPHKDQWDEDDVRKGILVSRLGFEDPSTGQLEVRYKYLSGNVREKLAIAEAYNTDGKYASNVEELRKAVPMDIPSHLIEFSLGSSWIPIELYKDYLKENYDLGNVKLTHIEGSWILDEGYSYRNEKNRSAGVYSEKFRETIYGHQLVAAALNNRPVKVAKQVSEGYGDSKTTKTVVDQAATQACAVRVDEIKDDFKQFVKKKIQEDPELAQRIEKIYNDKFNALVPMQIDDEFLPDHFEGSNVNITLRPHQKRGALRDLTAPTMLAHEVGTGKSFTLITTAMEMRRLGTAKKPMIVVQNATVAQMTSDAKLLYPNAKVLSLTEKDRDAEGRRAFYARIKYNDWDLIIVPQSTFERIPDSPERELQFIQEKIDEKKHVIEAAEAAGADSRQMQQMRKELEKLEQEYGDTFLDNDPANNSQKKSRKKDAKKEAASLDKAETKAKEMLDRAVDDVQFFDDLGVDALLVDEAHEYKHLGFQTSIGRGIKGIDPSYSKKCAGLYNKTRSVFEKVGWKNVVFATGTPISNTAAEIWTFMKYLMPADVMRQNDIYYFDDFVHNFGAISQMLEFTTSGKFKENTRFAAYVNRPELIRIWTQVADIVRSKDAKDVQEKIPEKEGGKDQDVFLPQSPSLISIMAAVRAELERFENMTGKEKKENSSIPLTMYGIAKRAAIDPRLVNPDAPDEPLSKTNAAVKEIVKDLKATQSYKGTVAVFCDNQNRLGKSADGKNVVEFNIYDDMREKLIKAGVPAEQIAIIKSGMSITAKQKVFDAVNTGAIRVVLGSTQTLGTGVNMQERLHLLIHMDAPDRPMDYTQRNGRIERQGNLHKVWGKPIRILRFGVEDSLDVTAYQRLKTKSGFIDSIMDGKGALLNNQVDRTVEEEEEGLFDNPVAVLSGSQYALKKNQAERELRKYLGKKAQWEADQVYVANTLRYNSREEKNLENLIKEEEDQLKHIRSLFPDGKVKTVTVEGEKIDLSKGDADAYVKMVKVFKEKIQDPVNAIVKRNRENPIYNDESLDYKVELDGHPIDFRVDVYRTSEYDNGKMRTVIHKQAYYNSPDLHIKSTMGSAKSVKELVEDIMSDVVTGNDYTDRIDAYNAKISRLNNETEQLKKRVGMEFQYGKELDEAKKHVDEYTELMKKEMEEKEAKYAAQQKEAQESGEGFDLKKAEDNEDEEVLRRSEEDYEDDESVFYSNAMMAVESIRQDKAAPHQWLAMIVKNGGLKAGEDKWLGLSDWLNNLNKKSITKQEVIDFIRENQIDVEEVHYKDNTTGEDVGNIDAEILSELEKEYPGWGEAFILNNDPDNGYFYFVNDIDKAIELYNRYNDDKVEDEDDVEIVEFWSTDQVTRVRRKVLQKNQLRPANETRLAYTTEGLKNKREIALVVPTIESWNQNDPIHFGDAGEGRAVAWIRFGETTTKIYDSNYERFFKEAHEAEKARMDFEEKVWEKSGKPHQKGELPVMNKEEKEEYDRLLRKSYIARLNVKQAYTNKNVLVIDEVQSKRHQDAREKGYKNTKAEGLLEEFRSDLAKKYPKGYANPSVTDEQLQSIRRFYPDTAELTAEEKDKYVRLLNAAGKKEGIPEAPFEKNWHELAMKRMLRYAAENGYDFVAWTTGEQQAERYNIGNAVQEIYTFEPDEYAKEYGEYLNIELVPTGNGEPIFVNVDKDGKIMSSDMDEFRGKNLSEVVGKELAVKLMQSEPGSTIKGEGLRVGGEGMKGFYDEILPRFMNKYGKKWGVQVHDINLPRLEGSAQTMHAVEVTPAMKESVMMGQPMFRDMETFSEGQTFPIYQEEMFSSYNVLGHRASYSTDLMPDEYATQQALLDALRNQYPEYYVTIEDNNVRMQSFNAVMADAEIANDAKKSKGTKSYVERKTRRAIDAVEDMANKMGLDVEVLTTTEGLSGKDAKAKGIFNKRTHKITIILPNHKTQSDVINTLLHEGVAHYGLRKMFGENFNIFLDNVYNNVDPQIKARIDAAMKRNGWSRHTATEEYLARLAERTDFEHAAESGWWQKIKDFFISMLAKAGFNTILTDNELRYILWRSYDNLLHPDARRNIFDKAREVDMMNRLKVGGYEERVPVRTSAEATPRVAEPEIDEITQIVSKAQANGTYLKAPNGQRTNLSEEQWAQVRTKAFKNWFGDWENDPENASKVVDENGEPKVMYHGTNLTKNNNGEPFWVFYPESHFGTQGQSKDILRNVNADQSTKTYEVFLNIRKPDRSQDVPKKYYGKSEHKEWWDALSDYAKKNGFDGIVYQNRWEDQNNPADSWIAFNSNQIKSATDNNGEYSPENDDIRYSLRTKEPPKKTGIGYKVFVLKNGQLYPPMVANPNGEGTPIGVWLDADAAPVAGTSKTGRPQVKAGGKGTQGGSGQLAYRPGWHLGEIPYALQFNRKDANGERTLFPNNFVWAEVEYADDVDYNEEARKEGTNASGKYQHSLAGLKHVPTDGSYKYRTNPDPRTDPWIITGAMRVNKILSREEVDELVRKAGREPQPMQDGDVLTQESIDTLNAEIQAMKEADEMGLLYRDDSDDVFDIARDAYEEAAASDALKFQEAWQDKMAGLKVLQNAIEKETGHKATGAEDAYLYENRMHGKAKNQSENYDRRYYRPLLKAADAMMKAKGWTEIRDLTDYLVAKHGLERNIFYAFKAAITGMVRDNINKEQRKLTKRYERGEIDAITYKKEQKKLAEREAKDIADKIKEVNNDPEHLRMLDDYENGRITYSDYITNEEDIRRSYAPDFDEHYKDYSGLTELTGDENDYTHLALAMVDAAENDHQEEVSDLWNAINAATKETLRFAYESGTMSRNTYNNVRAMFNYYVPLRGWEENNADDYYDYVSERNVFSTAIKKAYGRQSLAENPLAYIGNMAVSTLLAGHRNLLKQHFLNYVMNNPTSLVSISERWWENKGTETAPYWVEVSPEIPAGATADEIADIVEAFNEEMKQKAEEGRATTTRGSLDIKYHATGAEKDEHMVEVQRAGKTYQLYINGNPKAAQALNGTNEKAVSRISQTDFGQMVEKINRSMAAFFTSKNPAFVLSNLSRDLTMAGASVAVKEDAAYNAQFIKNVWKVLRPRSGRAGKHGFARKVTLGMYGKDTRGITGLLPSLMRKYLDGDLDLTNETERLFGEFMDEGGETGFVNMLSVDSFKEKMQKEIGQMQGTTLNIAKARKGTKETPIGKGLRLMGDIFEFYNRCAEDATRFIVYMTSRQMGKSLEDSIADAKDVTLNFNRKGTGAKWNAVVRDLFIFVNPAVQALANMFKMAYKHPLKLTAVTAAFMAGGALIPVFNQWLLNLFGDDDDKDAYWNLPPWVRKNNLVLWVPGTKNFITIPLAQEFRVFYGLGEMATSLIYDHPVHEWPMEILSSFMDLVPINPTGNGGNLVTDLTPTMFQPMSQLAFNTDFTGKPIWRENQGNKYAPMYTKAYVSTPEWMISLSEGVNDLTGGNEGKKGWVEEYLYGGDYINNPAVWNHLMQGYFGGMYNTIAKTFDVGVTTAKGELPKVYQTPVLNRFLNRPVERDNAGVLGDEYYALTEERDRLKYELRTWQKKADEGDADAQEHVDEIMQSEDYQRMLVIDHYDKIMKDLKAGEKAAKADYDKEDIKDMITMYKAQMMDELADIDGGMDPLEAAKAKFNSAKTKSERARLSKRIERLTMRQGESKKSGDDAVDKALSYRADDLKDKQEGRRESGEYLKLATAENIADDARIRIAKQKIKQYTDEYKRLVASGNSDRAGEYRKQNQKYFVADGIIQSQSRAISTNKKLLGKGHDEAIMKLIDANRQRMLKAIEGLE